MLKNLNPTIKSRLQRIWLDLNSSSNSTLLDPLHYYPSKLVLDDTSWIELETLLTILRDLRCIKIVGKLTNGGRHNIVIGYVIKVIQPEFSELENVLPDLSLNPIQEKEENNLVRIIPDDKTHKILRKMITILVDKERVDNYLLAKCIEPKLGKKAYGNGKRFKLRIKNRLKTLNKYLKKEGLFVSIDGKHSKISSYSIK